MSTSPATIGADSAPRVEEAIQKYGLSKRGAFNCTYRDVWGPREDAMANPWSPDNPDGVILLRLAENNLLHGEVADFVTKQLSVLPSNHLTYSTGPRGSRRLRKAVAEFLTDEFHSREAITLDDIFITPGLTSAIDAITWSICEEGDGILIPRPFYNRFNIDILHRSNARVVGVTYHDIDGYAGLDDVFRPDINRKALQSAFEKATQEGTKIRALMISNPHNPLGRCYPPETLEEFASFCSKHNLHLISDEIYAKSVFDNPAVANPTPFVSTLALDMHKIIDPKHLHVLYGASKDFCANGLRLGCIYSKNKGLLGAISSISPFSWSPHILQDVWAAMLEDRTWTRHMMQRKTRLMAADYRTITSFLKQKNIGFYPMNAGLFLWVDLRHLFQSCSSDQDAAFVQSHILHYKAIEDKVMELCGSNGVMIAPGSLYESEGLGWFRITFTVGEEALKEGLARVIKALEDLETCKIVTG